VSTDSSILSNVAYDDLVVGRRMGPYEETVSRGMAEQLAAEIGRPVAVDVAPPSVFPVLFLKALRSSMGGIPPKSILAKQELEFHRELPVDSTVSISTWIGKKEVKRDRPFVTIEFDIRDSDGDEVVTGRKVIVWPTGPTEERG
jgi:hypothetical protein